MPVVTVLVCTYNGEGFLRQQLLSIIEQTLPPDQLIVSDDSSTDDTVTLAADILRQAGWADRSTITTNPGPRGVAANFAHGLGLATGDLVALSDQDDVWRVDKLETMLTEFAARDELVLLHSDARLVDASGADLGETLLASLRMGGRERARIHAGRAFDALLRRNFVTGATVMLRRTLLDRALPIPPGWIHDEWLAIAASATGIVDFSAERLIDYRQHGTNEIGARELTAGTVVARFAEPRTDRNARLLLRAESLVERMPGLAARADLDAQHKVESKLAHERMRSALPASRIRRSPAIVLGLLRGGYSRYGRGIVDALRDLLQPA